MKTPCQRILPWVLGAGLVAFSASTLSAMSTEAKRVEVTYQNPEKFTDIQNAQFETERGREQALTNIRRHIERRAAAALPEGYSLAVTVNDVDLAGAYEPWRSRLYDVRIVRDLYPPRINLAYTLTDATGREVASGERKLTDLTFLYTNLSVDRQDPLRYEKTLIDDWIRQDVTRRLAVR